MNDPRTSPPSTNQSDSHTNSSRAGMAETLQQALRSLGGDRAALGNGGLSPEALAELAQRAGLTSPAQVADLSRMMGMGSANGPAAGVPQHIVFLIGDVECALPAENVQGVERITEIAAVPNTVPWVLGIIHLRGAILSVVDLRGFFSLPTQPITPRSRLLVVAKRDMTISFVVDGVTEMRPLGSDQLDRATTIATPEWAAAYAERAINIEGRVVVLLDPERLLYADKMHRYRADFS